MTRPAALAALALLAACGPAVDVVELRPRQAVLEAAGATVQLAATPRDHSGGALALPVRWTSYAPAVATVDAGGRVTAVRTGEATITADVGGVAAEARIRVAIPARAALAPAALELVGVPAQGELALRVEDEGGAPVPARPAAWRSSDERVATVAGGRVTAVGPGLATVTAAVGSLTASAQVTVRLPEFARIVVRPARLVLAAGRSARLEAGAVDASGRPVAGVPLVFASAEPRVASVSPDGTVTALRAGRARVLVAAAGKSAAVPVTVRR